MEPDSKAASIHTARAAHKARGLTASRCFCRRLNWQLHFGEPPKWAPGAQFVLVDPEPTARDAAKAAVALRGDAAAVAEQLRAALAGVDPQRWAAWRGELAAKVTRMLSGARCGCEERTACVTAETFARPQW